MTHCLSTLILCLGTAVAVPAAEEKKSATIADKTAEMKKLAGYFPLYWDEREGKLWLEIDRFEKEFLYLVSLAAGVGSNDIGLDRGQIGRTRQVEFRRVGPKVLLIQPNYGYRATTTDVGERRAVDESFAQSVLWGFKVEAEQEGRVLVDATSFYLRDAHQVAQPTLSSSSPAPATGSVPLIRAPATLVPATPTMPRRSVSRRKSGSSPVTG
jgi:hypothetical protein